MQEFLRMGGGCFFGGSNFGSGMSRNTSFAHHPFTVGDQQPLMVVQSPLIHLVMEINPMGIRYLFKKELKKSDVSQSRRIVIPKRAAETHLPFLYDKRGLFMNMEDMDGMGFWCFRFRYWPNNHSRMYILENTGERICEAHGLEVGDYILLYKDDGTGKYVIEATKAEVPRSVRKVINTPPSTEQLELVDDDEAGYRFANCFPVVDDYALIFDDFTATFDDFPDASAGEGGAPPENQDEDKPSSNEDPKDFDEDEFP